MKRDLLYYISTVWSLVKLFFFRNAESSIIVFGRRVFFSNINCIGIIGKNVSEVDNIRKEIYRSCDLFCDIGAHVGIKILAFNYSNPKAQIIAFEPSGITYNFLKRNVSHIPKCQIFKVALSNKVGEEKFFYDSKHLDVASLNKEHYFLVKNSNGNICEENINVKKLDEYTEYLEGKNKVFLKIDVESLEKKVLEGGQEFIKRVNFLEIEISQGNDYKFSEILNLIPKKFNVINFDIFKGDDHMPKAVNVFLELY